MNFSSIEKIAEKYGAALEFNVRLAPFTSFKIGGNAEAVLKANGAECIAEAVTACKNEKIPLHILGKGSNVLISDKGLKGLVIVLGADFADISAAENELICCAGAPLVSVCLKARDNALTGLEFAYGIPGTVGGALYMNAGAYGGEMKQAVKSCTYLDENGRIAKMDVEEMDLSYRHSVFATKNYVILSVTLALENGDKTAISTRMSELMDKRKQSQPLDYGSAGSTFKRPEGDYAARLIEAAGLKGFSCGGAEVSTKHSGFVINRNNASFDDVMNVINGVKKRVLEFSGRTLECEVLIWE